jgi:bifunctional ADP-heptose synthase (sugar kinase/adenylyltransferase)
MADLQAMSKTAWARRPNPKLAGSGVTKETMAKSILSRYDGCRHIRGAGVTGLETLCGACDSGDEYTESTEPTNCAGCIETAKIVFASISKRDLASCEGQQAVYTGRLLCK